MKKEIARAALFTVLSYTLGFAAIVALSIIFGSGCASAPRCARSGYGDVVIVATDLPSGSRSVVGGMWSEEMARQVCRPGYFSHSDGSRTPDFRTFDVYRIQENGHLTIVAECRRGRIVPY